jgi:uncharacterized protein YkwD
MTPIRSVRLAVVVLLFLVLTACGGGSGGNALEDSAEPNPPVDDGTSPGSGGGGGAGSGSSPDSTTSPGDTSGSACPTAAEEAILRQINAARTQTRECGSTRFAAAGPLAWDCRLQQAALSHSADMAGNNFFDHSGSDGLTAGDRISAQGYVWSVWGENIAAGHDNFFATLNAWLDSPGHCANIMDPNFTDVGVGDVSDPGSDFGIYWTQVFARPARSVP